MSGVFLRVDGSVQLTEDKQAQLLVLQQAAHFFHVEPADSLPLQDALHHFLQELLVLAETSTDLVFSLTYWAPQDPSQLQEHAPPPPSLTWYC